MITLSENKGRIGIISGSGPEAGIDLWREILAANRRFCATHFQGDLDAPNVSIFSVPELGLSMNLEKNEDLVWTCLESSIRQLAQRVDLICIACHTLHYFDDKIVKLKLQPKYVSMVEIVTDYIRKNRFPRLAILGTCDVMKLGRFSPYAQLQNQVEIERLDCRRIHRLVLLIKRLGSDDSSIRPALEAILADVKSEAILLACTELSLVQVHAPTKHLIDGTLLLANEVVRRSLAMKRCK